MSELTLPSLLFQQQNDNRGIKSCILDLEKAKIPTTFSLHLIKWTKESAEPHKVKQD